MTHEQAYAKLAEAGIRFSRKEYMAKEVSHQDYYSQFVDPATISAIESRIGRDRVLASTDPHFNDIPLQEWDRIAPLPPSRLIAIANITTGASPSDPSISLSDRICILKAAARMMKEGRA